MLFSVIVIVKMSGWKMTKGLGFSMCGLYVIRAGLRGGGGVGMGVSGMVSVGLVLGCIEAKFCKKICV